MKDYEIQLYVYGLFVELKDERQIELEWSKEAKIGVLDYLNGGYEIPTTTYTYENCEEYYDIEFDPNYMEFFKERALKEAFKKILCEINKQNI